MKNLRRISKIIFSLGLIFVTVGASYAFFMYGKTGLYSYAINGGKMDIIYDETTGNNITLNNFYPMTDIEALTGAIEFEFTITGYNQSDSNIFYSIEMDYGNDVTGKTRLPDSNLKLSLEENEILVFKNKIFSNLDNQGIYYGYIKSGTSVESPTINHYVLHLWVNDNVYLTNSIPNDSNEWGEDELNWAYSVFGDKISTIEDGTNRYLSDLGYSVYTTSEFENSYSSFKVNVRADLTGENVGNLLYDANGGEYTPKQTSLLTNKITLQKPVKDGKAFLGWSEDENATVPTYKSGDYYGGIEKILYAVYGDTRNVMGTFPSTITSQKDKIVEIYFIDDTESNITARYGASIIKADLTYDSQGSVKCWTEANKKDNTKYNLYIGSSGTTYLNTGSELLYSFMNAQIIDLTNVDSSMVTSMNNMIGHYYYDSSTGSNVYDGCINLTSIDVSGLNTSSVIDMQSLFVGCANLTNLDLSAFDTSKVTDMNHMFYGCSSLTSIDVSNFDTSSVTNISYMFHGCSSLTSIDVSNFNTSFVTNMSYMFCQCAILTNIDVSNFNTSFVTNMSYMFAACEILTNIDLSNFDTSNVTNMAYMFYRCDNLMSINLSNFDTSNLKIMSYMFSRCTKLANVDLSNFNTSLVTNMEYMFYRCENLTSIDLSNFDTSLVKNMSYMFCRCLIVTSIDVSNFDTSNVTNMSYMFYRCENLTIIDVSDFDTSLVTDMSYTFYACLKLTSIDVSNFDTSLVTNMAYMFYSCSAVTSINVSNFDTSLVTNMTYMFCRCSILTSIDVSNFNTSLVTNMSYMFYGCLVVTSLDVSHFNTSLVTDMSYMFYRCKILTIIDASNFDTSNVTNMTEMFRECNSLEKLDISNFTFNATITGSTGDKYYEIFRYMRDDVLVTVKSATEQSWILSLGSNNRPSAWSTTNVVVKTV